MSRNIVETIMGFLVILAAVLFVVFALSKVGALQNGEGYTVSAEFDDASGVTSGTEVRMSGIKVGSVVSQELDPQTYFANVVLSIDDHVELPVDTSARIVPETLLGGTVIVLTPGGEETMLKAGETIAHTQGAINIVDLLGRFIFSSTGGGDDGPS